MEESYENHKFIKYINVVSKYLQYNASVIVRKKKTANLLSVPPPLESGLKKWPCWKLVDGPLYGQQLSVGSRSWAVV
jgi:hypothetical protein